MLSYQVIEKIVEKKDTITIYWREKYNKTLRNVKFKIEGDYVIGDFNGYKPIHIACLKKDLVEEINKYSFSAIINQYEYVRKKEARDKKKAKVVKLKTELMSTLKTGDVVERIGKTPNLGLYLIKVDEVDDYGISGFYIRSNGERTNEYTKLSWDYIKGVAE